MSTEIANVLRMITPESFASALLGGVAPHHLADHGEWLGQWHAPMLVKACEVAVSLTPQPDKQTNKHAFARQYVEDLVKRRDKFARRAHRLLPPSWVAQYQWTATLNG